MRKHCKFKNQINEDKKMNDPEEKYEIIDSKIDDIDEKYRLLIERMNILEKENQELKNQIAKTNIGQQQNVNCNTYTDNTINKTVNKTINNGTVIQNNITLVAYNKEDISKIKDEMGSILQKGFYAGLKLTEALHFNPKYPEYHNVYISNMKDKYAMVYNGTDWNLVTKDTLIDEIYDNKKNYIEDNLENLIMSHKLRPSQINALKRWLDTDDDTPKIKEIKEEIKLLLYNKRNIPLATKNSMSNNNDIDKNVIITKKRIKIPKT
jgi:hypothetical protein